MLRAFSKKNRGSKKVEQGRSPIPSQWAVASFEGIITILEPAHCTHTDHHEPLTETNQKSKQNKRQSESIPYPFDVPTVAMESSISTLSVKHKQKIRKLFDFVHQCLIII